MTKDKFIFDKKIRESNFGHIELQQQQTFSEKESQIQQIKVQMIILTIPSYSSFTSMALSLHKKKLPVFLMSTKLQLI